MTSKPRSLVDQIAIWNALVASFDQPFELLNGAQAFLASAPQVAVPTGLSFVLQTGQGALQINVVSLPFASISGAQVDLADIPSLPPPLPAILTDGLRDLLLELLPDTLRTQIVSAELGEIATIDDTEVIMVTVLGRNWPEAGQFVIQGPRAVLAALAAMPGATAPVPTLPQALACLIPLSVRIVLRGRVIPLRVMRSLEVGDIILPPPHGAQILLLGGKLVAGLTNDIETWTITELAVNNENDLPDVTQVSEAAPEAASLDDIPISLAFVIDTRTIPLSDLQNLRPGAALPFTPLSPTAGIEVQVLANGRAIGSGNIVEIDGRHAVRLSRLFGHN